MNTSLDFNEAEELSCQDHNIMVQNLLTVLLARVGKLKLLTSQHGI